MAFTATKPNPEKVDVIIFTEATYPFVKGGVSTVIHQIIEAHPDLSFGVIYIGWQTHQPLTSKYPQLDQLKWINTIFLNKSKKLFSIKDFFKKFIPRRTKKLCRVFLEDLHFALNGNMQKCQQIYQNFFNPKTRKVEFNHFAHSSLLFKEIFNSLQDKDISLNELYWFKNDFVKILNNLITHTYPKASVYHSHTQGYAALAASIAAYQNNKKFFLTEHSLYLRDVKQYLENDFNQSTEKQNSQKFIFNSWIRWFEMIGNWNYERAHKISYLYPKISEEAVLLGSKKNRTTIIPNGINYNDFVEAREAQQNHLKTRFQKHHQWIFSLIGRIVPVKGILDIIETAHYLKLNWDQPFVFELVGPFDEDPDYFEECKKKVTELNLNCCVHFLGPQKVQEYLKKPDLIILSSHSEALPMAALEGMACGLPIISTDVGSIRDIIQDPLLPCGYISPPKEPINLAFQIIKIISNPTIYKNFSENAKQKVKLSYDLKKVMNSYGSIYRELASSIELNEQELYV